MMWIIVTIATIVFCLTYSDTEDKIEEHINPKDVALVISLLIIVITIFLFIFQGFYGWHKYNKMEYSQYQKYNEVKISALEDNKNIQGNVYFHSGYIDEKMYYYYMEVLSDGNKKMNKIPAEDTIIIEKSNTYKIEFYKSFKEYKDKLFGGLFTWNDTIYQYKLYVPNGTVTNDYNIDLK
jgi:heme/copper-type cytochrome/quinol oxidase subunit 2